MEEIQLERIDHGEEAVDGLAGVQVYEEIRESAVDTTAETITPSQAAVSVTVPQYEDVQPVMPAKSYNVTQCAAYGVSLNN